MEPSTESPAESAVRTVAGEDTPVAEPGGGPLEPGTRIDRYVVLATLGQGGMGVVYAAHDTLLDRRVALKLLRPGSSRDPARARERLLGEAQAMARISSPHVVTVHDVGVFGDEVYLTMAYVQGVTARAWVRGGQHGWRSVLAICRQAALGLQAVHAAGLLHRDVKPDNVMIGDDGRVWLMDLGISLLIRGDPSSAASDSALGDARRPRGRAGTPSYMAPELQGGDDSPASDEFALCVTMFELLYGGLPFEGVTMIERAAATLAGEVRNVGNPLGVPRAVREVVLRGLAPRAAARWPSVEALVVALDRASTQGRRRVVVGAVVAAAIGAVALAAAPGEAAPCTGAAAELATVWSPARAEAIAAGLERGRTEAQLAWTRDTWARVGSQLDRFAGAWIDVHTAACGATRIRGERSTALLDRSMACLARQRVRVDALLGTLEGDGARRLERAAEAAAKLPRPAECEAELDAGPAPSPAEDEARVRIARATQLAELGEDAAAISILLEVEATARELDSPGLLAEAQAERGASLSDLDRVEEAHTVLVDAFVGAQRAGLRMAGFRAAVALMFVVSYQSGRQADAELWSRLAEASLGDELRGSRQAVLLADGQGLLAYDRGEFQAAVLAYERALAMLDGLDGEHDTAICTIHDHLGTARFELGELEAAGAEYDRAIEGCERAFGAGHPRAATPMVNRAQVESARGDLVSARQHVQDGLAIYLAALGPNDVRVARMHHNLGTLYHQLEQPEAARSEYEAAVASLRIARGPEHPDLVLPMIGVANLDLDEGRAREAVAGFDEALRVGTASLGAEHPMLLGALVGRASALRDLGELAAARISDQRAVVIAEAVDGQSGLVEALIGLALDQRAAGELDAAAAGLARARGLAVEQGLEDSIAEIDRLSAPATAPSSPP